VLRPDNFIYFFTVSGFFIGLVFSILNFYSPEDILIYTAGITFFFYLFIHVVIMNFVDIRRFGVRLFNKKEYENVSEYFIAELDSREKLMDGLLLELEKMNVKYEASLSTLGLEEGSEHKKAA
jgi:hypothetical protein